MRQFRGSSVGLAIIQVLRCLSSNNFVNGLLNLHPMVSE